MKATRSIAGPMWKAPARASYASRSCASPRRFFMPTAFPGALICVIALPEPLRDVPRHLQRQRAPRVVDELIGDGLVNICRRRDVPVLDGHEDDVGGLQNCARWRMLPDDPPVVREIRRGR